MLNKTLRLIRESGHKALLEKFLDWVFARVRHKLKIPSEIRRRKSLISKILDGKFKSTVNYGPFKGMLLPPTQWWGSTSRAAMLLGIYEQEVSDLLVSIPQDYKTLLVDLGAADGYYSVGALVGNLYKTCICFELEEKGQKTIIQAANINNVTDRIKIFGKADESFYKFIDLNLLNGSTILIDIEGQEFNILNENTFLKIPNSFWIIELHDHYFSDGSEMIKDLISIIPPSYKSRIVLSGSRDLSKFPELRSFSDDDRWLICSESRSRMAQWLVIEPV